MKYSVMFAGAGIGELYLDEIGYECVVANELIEKRAKFYQHIYPKANMIIGDINDYDVFARFIRISKENEVKMLIATPPCQGFSIIGRNKSHDQMTQDQRNFLVYKVFEAIKEIQPDYVLIENVPRFLNLYYPHEGGMYNIIDIIKYHFESDYNIDYKILNSMHYEIAQSRKRSFIKIYKKDKKWPWPTQSDKIITVKDTIGHLPSIEAGEASEIKWHYGRNHKYEHIEWMKNTPTGKSAYNNAYHFPKNDLGLRIKGYNDAYSRIEWDKPAPTITIRSDAISSNAKVHPGRRLSDGTYSDARVLSILEIMLLSSIPVDWDIPTWASDTLIRQIIGESVPPLLMKKIIEAI